MKRGTPNHPKISQLMIELSIPRYAAIGLVESLLHFAAEYTPAGDVGRYSDAYLAQHLDWKGDSKALIKAMAKAGWLDKSKKSRLIIHDWSQHADDSVQMKLFRARQRFADDKMPNPSRISKEERERILKEYVGECAHAVPTAEGTALPLPLPLPSPIPMPCPTPTPTTPGPNPNPLGSGSGDLSNQGRGNGMGKGNLSQGMEETLKMSMLHAIEMDSEAKMHIVRRRDVSSEALKRELDRLQAQLDLKQIDSIGGCLYGKYYLPRKLNSSGGNGRR